MKRPIVIIGANEFQNRLILRAKALGFETHVFAWLEGAVGRETADYFYPISIAEREEILTQCEKIAPVAVTSVASDLAVPTVSYICQKLRLPGNSVACASASTNKYLMRQCFLQAGVSTPGFARVTSSRDCAVDFKFPLIVKPTDRSGSRGVTKVFTSDALKQAVEACIAVSFEKAAIIEEFIEGEEFSAEYISFGGCHHFLTVTKKFTTGAPHFIETGHVQPAALPEPVLARVRAEIEKGLDALGIQNGASHPEFKISKDGSVHLIEIGARMGGDCIGSDLVPLSTGYDFLKMVIDTACGLPPEILPVEQPRCAAIRFIFGQSDLALLEHVRREAPATLYRSYLSEPVFAHAVTDSSTRFGYFILTAHDKPRILRLAGFDDNPPVPANAAAFVCGCDR